MRFPSPTIALAGEKAMNKQSPIRTRTRTRITILLSTIFIVAIFLPLTVSASDIDGHSSFRHGSARSLRGHGRMVAARRKTSEAGTRVERAVAVASQEEQTSGDGNSGPFVAVGSAGQATAQNASSANGVAISSTAQCKIAPLSANASQTWSTWIGAGLQKCQSAAVSQVSSSSGTTLVMCSRVGFVDSKASTFGGELMVFSISSSQQPSESSNSTTNSRTNATVTESAVSSSALPTSTNAGKNSTAGAETASSSASSTVASSKKGSKSTASSNSTAVSVSVASSTAEASSTSASIAAKATLIRRAKSSNSTTDRNTTTASPSTSSLGASAFRVQFTVGNVTLVTDSIPMQPASSKKKRLSSSAGLIPQFSANVGSGQVMQLIGSFHYTADLASSGGSPVDSQLASLSPNNVQVVTAGGSSNATSFLVDLTAQSAQDPGFSAASWGLFSRSGPGSSSKVGAANGVVNLKQSGSGGRVAELIVQDSSCQLSNRDASGDAGLNSPFFSSVISSGSAASTSVDPATSQATAASSTSISSATSSSESTSTTASDTASSTSATPTTAPATTPVDANGGETSASSTPASTTSDSVALASAAAASLAQEQAASQAAASASATPFQLPGRSLSVLPIGLGIFAGISVIALVIVGFVTYERRKYRRNFRQRKMAEAAGFTNTGYGTGGR